MTGIVAAVGLAADLLSGIIALQQQFTTVSSLILKAQAEGRDITDEELAALKAVRDAARKAAAEA